MRTSTRRKYWGRSGVAQALRGAQHALEGAIAETGKETPLELALKEVSKELGQALEAWKVYQLEQKRVRGKIEREMKNISDILAEVKGIPVTKEEKIAKKVTKTKLKGGDQ